MSHYASSHNRSTHYESSHYSGIVQQIIEFFGGNDGPHIEDDKLIFAIIKAFIARI